LREISYSHLCWYAEASSSAVPAWGSNIVVISGYYNDTAYAATTHDQLDGSVVPGRSRLCPRGT
jgi:hypothetical protein